MNWVIIYVLYSIVCSVSVSSTKKDIVFIIDRSLSISNEQFTRSIEFIYNVTHNLRIGPQNFLISVVLFDNAPVGVFDFDSHITKQSLLQAIHNINRTGGGPLTNTALALNYSFSLLTAQNGSRSNAERAVIVVTDGDSNDRVNTHHAADNLRKNNITVYGMGIGTHVSTDEITELAGGHQNVHRVSDFVYLCNLVPALVLQLDPSIISNVGINNCPTEPSTTTSLMVTTIFRTITSTYMMSVGNQYTLISNKRKDKDTVGVIAGVTSSVCLLVLLLLLLLILRKFIKDHEFDKAGRTRGKKKRKTGDVTEPDHPARGCKPVCQFHRRDETKILPHARRGLKLED